MRLEHFLHEHARQRANKTVLVAGTRRVSYAELDEMSTRLAASLQQQGIERGDRVLVFLDNCVEAAISIFAIVKAGAVFSTINPTTKTDKLAYMLNKCSAKGLITHQRLLRVARGAIAPAGCVKVVIAVGSIDADVVSWSDAIATAPALRDVGGISADLAMIIHTSGSSGMPKGAMMTHQNIFAAGRSVMSVLENSENDIILSVLPLSFNYGLYQLLMTVMMGGTLVLENSFTYPHKIIQKMQQERVTGFPLLPTIAAILVQMESLKPECLPDLRYITNTAASLPPAHIAKLREICPRTKIYSMYGLTECKRATWLPPEQLAIRPNSVGKAIPDTEVWIVDDKNNRVGPGIIGELVVRGPTVMQGYWDNPEATARALRPGPNPWEKVLYSGDLFRMDEEGYFYFVGRKDDIIKTRGEKVSPREVEDVLYALPEVREAMVVGVPDPILGAAIKAVIVLMPGSSLSAHDIMRHCAARLEDLMVPKLVEFREELPKTSTGKLRRADLQSEFVAAGARS